MSKKKRDINYLEQGLVQIIIPHGMLATPDEICFQIDFIFSTNQCSIFGNLVILCIDCSLDGEIFRLIL